MCCRKFRLGVREGAQPRKHGQKALSAQCHGACLVCFNYLVFIMILWGIYWLRLPRELFMPIGAGETIRSYWVRGFRDKTRHQTQKASGRGPRHGGMGSRVCTAACLVLCPLKTEFILEICLWGWRLLIGLQHRMKTRDKAWGEI